MQCCCWQPNPNPRRTDLAHYQAFHSGISIRQAEIQSGVSKETVLTIFRDYEKRFGPRLCVCGKDAKHQGWCWFRFKQSEARQAFMKKRWGRPQATDPHFSLANEPC